MRRRIVKYWAYAEIGYREARQDAVELYGRVAFLALILGVFSALWKAVGAHAMPLMATPRSMVWYLATTEWILLSTPQLYAQVEQEVRQGDVTYQLTRPVSYLGSRLARGFGALLARSPLLFVGAVGLARLFSGGWPERWAGVLYVIPLGLLASFILMACYLVLGLFAFWLGDITPLYWIWQKATFVLGGLMLPLEFYPPLFIRFAHLTPFPTLLNEPASFIFEIPSVGLVRLVLGLFGWLLVAIIFAQWLFRRAISSLAYHGG
jgi:ABC-2 type transport system permease protein